MYSAHILTCILIYPHTPSHTPKKNKHAGLRRDLTSGQGYSIYLLCELTKSYIYHDHTHFLVYKCTKRYSFHKSIIYWNTRTS